MSERWKRILIGLGIITALSLPFYKAWAVYATKNYQVEGGATWKVGGDLDVVNGGNIDIESGGVFNIGGVAVDSTAAELNTVDLSAVGALVKIKKLSITATPTGLEQDTTWDLPAKSLVLDVFVDVTTAEATGTTKTLDVGLLSSESGGDTDGFISKISVSATGRVRAIPTLLSGAVETYLGTTQEIGALLRSFQVGTDTSGDHGLLIMRPYAVGTPKSVVYQAASTNWAEFRGDIYVLYIEIS